MPISMPLNDNFAQAKKKKNQTALMKKAFDLKLKNLQKNQQLCASLMQKTNQKLAGKGIRRKEQLLQDLPALELPCKTIEDLLKAL